MGVRLPSPRIGVFATAFSVVALALSAATSDARATAGAWGHWADVDAYTASKILSLCPTQADCTGAAGAQKLQVLATGTIPRRLDSLLGVRNRFGSTVSMGVPLALLPSLASAPGMRSVHLDDPVHGTGSAGGFSAASLATLWPQIDNAPAAWAQGLTGAGIGVAVIDTGVDDLPDFGGRVVHVDVSGTSVSTSAPDAIGHGTFVAGVLGGRSSDGRFTGIAPGVTIYAINIAGADGSAYTSDAIAALAWVRAHARADNIRVVNMSFTENDASNYNDDPLDSAVEQLWQSGIVMVAAAGNLGPDTVYFAPANDPFVITVGATDTNDTLDTADDTQATFSSYGFTLDGWPKPELLAPGRHVVSTLPLTLSWGSEAPAANVVAGPYYVSANGTSFSAPQVAGAAALLLQQSPNLQPDQVKSLLEQTSRTVPGTPGGALDVGAALAYGGAVQPANAGIVPAPRYVVIQRDGIVSFDSSAFAGTDAPGAVWRGDASGNSASTWSRAANTWNRAANTWNGDESWSRAANTWNAVESWSRAANTWNGDSWTRAANTWNGDNSWARAANTWNADDFWARAANTWNSASVWN